MNLATGSRYSRPAPGHRAFAPRPSRRWRKSGSTFPPTSKSVDEFVGQDLDYVITVCSNANETCPVFPGATQRLHWPFDDPAAVEGAGAVRQAAFCRIRDQIHARIMVFLGGVLFCGRRGQRSPERPARTRQKSLLILAFGARSLSDGVYGRRNRMECRST